MEKHLTDKPQLQYSIESMGMEEENGDVTIRKPDITQEPEVVVARTENKKSTLKETLAYRKQRLYDVLKDKTSTEDIDKIFKETKDLDNDTWKGVLVALSIIDNPKSFIGKLKELFSTDVDDKKGEKKDSSPEKDGDVEDKDPTSEDGTTNRNTESPHVSTKDKSEDKAEKGGKVDKIISHLSDIREYSSKIERNTREMIDRLDKIISLTEDDIKRLLEEGNQKLERLVYAIERVGMDKDGMLDEAGIITRAQEKEAPEEQLADSLRTRVDSVKNFDQLLDNVMGPVGAFASYAAGEHGVASAYARDMEEVGWGKLFDDDHAFEGDRDALIERFQEEAAKVRQRVFEMRSEGRSLDEAKAYINDRIEDFVELHAKARKQAEKDGTLTELREDPNPGRRERDRSKIRNFNELASAIMQTHPDFGPGTDNALLEIQDGREVIREDNFIKWIRSQLIYYHAQDPDNPQINFFSSINVDLPDMYRTVNIFSMINNPGTYFRDSEGIRLKKLQDEMTREVWLFGQIRNNHIAYQLSMPLDEKIGEVLVNMYQNNVLTKVADEGRSPLYWILSMPERFKNVGSEDSKVGTGLSESIMIYYNLTDFHSLYHNYAGETSPLFNFKKIKSTVKTMLYKQGRPANDTYYRSDIWQKLEGFFDENDNFKWTGTSEEDRKNQVEYMKFLNIYQPQKDQREIDLVRALVRETMQERMGMTDESAEFAEQFAQFFLRWTLVAARADMGAPAMDAGEKVARMYLEEKGPSSSNPGYGNVKSVNLRRQLALTFFDGTYVRDGELKDHKYGRADENGFRPYILSANGRERILLNDESVIQLKAEEELIRREDGSQVIQTAKVYRDREGIPEDVKTQTFHNARKEIVNGHTVITDMQGHPMWDEAEQKERIKRLTGFQDVQDENILIDIGSEKIRAQDGFRFTINITVRDWALDEHIGRATTPQRILIRKAANDVGYEIVDTLSADDKLIVEEKGRQKITMQERAKEATSLVTKIRIYYKMPGDKGKKHFYELNDDEYLEQHGNTITITKGEDRQILFEYNTGGEKQAEVSYEKYMVQRSLHRYSTYEVMDKMHQQVMFMNYIRDVRFREDGITPVSEENRQTVLAQQEKELTNITAMLKYDADTMRQFASNHLNRAFQMFHERNKKHMFDIKQIWKGFDEQKGFVFDTQAIQDIFTEQLVKIRRYAYRTYLIDMSKIVRGISHDNTDEFESMHVAEALFGQAVLDMFVMPDGNIDWEFLSTSTGALELVKTELIMALAAEESQLDDFDFPEPKMTLQAKIAYREALHKAIMGGYAGNEIHLNPKDNKFKFDFFHGRKISFDEKANHWAHENLDYMQVFEATTGASESNLFKQQLKRDFLLGGLLGLGEMGKQFIIDVFKG